MKRLLYMHKLSIIIFTVIVAFLLVSVISGIQNVWAYPAAMDSKDWQEESIATQNESIGTKELTETQEETKKSQGEDIEPERITPHELIAHAGGAIYGFCYTNSLEALNSSYNKGFRFIEIDLEWTSDGYPVAIHDWNAMVKRLFMIEPKVLTIEEFRNGRKFMNLTLMDMEALSEWLKEHKDVYIITDIKNRNLEMLEYIKENYPEIHGQIIPQIHFLEDYDKAKGMGYKNIILTLYMMKLNYMDVVNFVSKNELFAVTMDIEQGFSGLPEMMSESGTRMYVHTINTLSTVEALREKGVFGVYTDYFEPIHWIDTYVDQEQDFIDEEVFSDKKQEVIMDE
ncbi:MAG: glycerophosphodiester phosphodiesterase family protein [Acetivibrionales bacterium]